MLGSRMRRLSEYFLAEVNRVYQQEEIEFDAGWFPVFFILSKTSESSLRDIADRIQVSHSAVSQLINNLKKRNLVETSVSIDDRRVQLVRLTEKGKHLLREIQPIWQSLETAMHGIGWEDRDAAVLLNGLTAIENQFREVSLSERVQKELKNQKINI